MQRFRRGLGFKAHRLLHHSTLGLRVKKKREGGAREMEGTTIPIPIRTAAALQQSKLTRFDEMKGHVYILGEALLGGGALQGYLYMINDIYINTYLRIVLCSTPWSTFTHSAWVHQISADETRSSARRQGKTARFLPQMIDSWLETASGEVS